MLWKPAFFGVKPAMVLKGGMIAAAAMGDPNASIPTPQPVHYRPMFGAFGGALRSDLRDLRLAQRRSKPGMPEELGLRRRAVAVRDTRRIGKTHMIHNDYQPQIDVDPQTYEVRADGVLLTCEPARCCRWRSGISCFDRGDPSSPRAEPWAWRYVRFYTCRP